MLCTGIRKWTAGVERKENAPFGPGGEVEVKTCSWAFVLCTGRPKKKSREQKAVISYKYSAFRGSQFLWLPKRKRGGLCVGGGSAVRQMRDVSARVCVCVCACLHQWVCLLPPGALYILHECVCVSLLRVIDNLESFSFPEWQIRGGSWFVVIQSHKRGHAAYGKIQDTNVECYLDACNSKTSAGKLH